MHCFETIHDPEGPMANYTFMNVKIKKMQNYVN